jgi:hypothetical protein
VHLLVKRNFDVFTICISESATQIAVTASGTPDRLTIQITPVVWRKRFLRSALSCVITQNCADLVDLAAAAWSHVQNFVMLRMSPLVTLQLITASSQMPYRVLLTPGFTPFLKDTVHMCRVPSLSLIYPSWQIIFGVATKQITDFYILLTVHLDVILVNDQLDSLFFNVFISCLYMFRATSAHHQEDQLVSIHHLV